MKKNGKTLVNLSTKTFIQVVVLLFVLMLAAIVLTYVIPKGAFGTTADGKTDYLDYRPVEGAKGIPVWKGLLAPFLVFGSDNGLTLIMLSLFLVMVFAAFQVMNDVGGIRALVGAVARRFQKRRALLLCMIALVFMAFGAFLGLFEEMLSMLPIVTALCVLIGYDSFTGFLVCIIACGFGFASAITNPFTVLLASEIIGANPMEHIWYRVIIFVVMYLLLLGFGALHDQLVVHLHNEPRRQSLSLQALGNTHHGQLDDIGSGALNGHIQRHALTEGAQIEVGAGQLRQRAAAVHQCFHKAPLTGGLHHLLHIRLDSRIGGKIAVHIVLGLRHRDADILRQ